MTFTPGPPCSTNIWPTVHASRRSLLATMATPIPLQASTESKCRRTSHPRSPARPVRRIPPTAPRSCMPDFQRASVMIQTGVDLGIAPDSIRSKNALGSRPIADLPNRGFESISDTRPVRTGRQLPQDAVRARPWRSLVAPWSDAQPPAAAGETSNQLVARISSRREAVRSKAKASRPAG